MAGMIAAGAPLEAVALCETCAVPQELVEGRGRCFVLRVRGDSMIDEQIRNGDLVVVERREVARDGETVVALIGGSDATLKRFYRAEPNVRLEPANAAMEPLVLPADEVTVQGVVVGVIRKY
jgi:repressor LexA